MDRRGRGLREGRQWRGRPAGAARRGQRPLARQKHWPEARPPRPCLSRQRLSFCSAGEGRTRLPRPCPGSSVCSLKTCCVLGTLHPRPRHTHTRTHSRGGGGTRKTRHLHFHPRHSTPGPVPARPPLGRALTQGTGQPEGVQEEEVPMPKPKSLGGDVRRAKGLTLRVRTPKTTKHQRR